MQELNGKTVFVMANGGEFVGNFKWIESEDGAYPVLENGCVLRSVPIQDDQGRMGMGTNMEKVGTIYLGDFTCYELTNLHPLYAAFVEITTGIKMASMPPVMSKKH